MFQRVDIKLTGPICTCDKQSLSWAMNVIETGLTISCDICGTQLKIPNSKCVARFVLDVPYPNDDPSKKEKATLHVIDGEKKGS